MSEARQSKNNTIVNGIKLYLFPSVVTLLAAMIWRDVNELRTDVKQLLAEASSNKSKVERLEKQVDVLNQAVFKMPKASSRNERSPFGEETPQRLYAVLTKEEYSYIKKYPTTKTN